MSANKYHGIRTSFKEDMGHDLWFIMEPMLPYFGAKRCPICGQRHIWNRKKTSFRQKHRRSLCEIKR